MNKKEILTRIDNIEKDKMYHDVSNCTVQPTPCCVPYIQRSSSSYELYNLPFQTPKLGDFLNVL